MRKGIVVVLLVALLSSVLGTARAQGRPFTVELTGAAEVDNPTTPEVETGDPDASGVATLTFNPGLGEVCIEASFDTTSELDGAEDLVGAHIHKAPAGSSGGIVVPFPEDLIDDATNTISGCVDAERDLILDILRHPEEYYLNLHTAAFPTGAVRGQLG